MVNPRVLLGNPLVSIPVVLSIYVLLVPSSKIRSRIVDTTIGIVEKADEAFGLYDYVQSTVAPVLKDTPLIGNASTKYLAWGSTRKPVFLITLGTALTTALAGRKYGYYLLPFYAYSIVKDASNANAVFSSLPLLMYAAYGHKPRQGFNGAMVYAGYLVSLLWYYRQSHGTTTQASGRD